MPTQRHMNTYTHTFLQYFLIVVQIKLPVELYVETSVLGHTTPHHRKQNCWRRIPSISIFQISTHDSNIQKCRHREFFSCLILVCLLLTFPPTLSNTLRNYYDDILVSEAQKCIHKISVLPFSQKKTVLSTSIDET